MALKNSLGLALLILFLNLSPLLADLIGDSSFEGVVTSLSGVPTVERDGFRIPLAPGQLILPDDQIILESGDEIRLLLRTGRLIESQGPRRINPRDELGQEDWYSPIIRSVLDDRFGLFDSEMNRGPDALTNAFRQLVPYNASILDGKAEFVWKAPDDYRDFALVINEEDPISTLSRQVAVIEAGDKTSLVVDGRAFGLETGTPYSWRVRASQNGQRVETGRVFFRLLDGETSYQLRQRLIMLEEMKKGNQDAMPWVIGSILLMKERLYHEALEYVARAISVNDLAPFPFTLRGRIYEEMNLPNQALVEYQVALRLGN